MRKIILFFFLAGMFFMACNNQVAKERVKPDQENSSVGKSIRYGMVTGVKEDKLEYYKALHAHPWPAVIEKLKECNVKNYSIYLQKIEDEHFLFSYFEYDGIDFDSDMKKMAADTATQRWWKETDPCQLPLKEALAKKEIWTVMEEVFHMD